MPGCNGAQFGREVVITQLERWEAMEIIGRQRMPGGNGGQSGREVVITSLACWKQREAMNAGGGWGWQSVREVAITPLECRGAMVGNGEQ